MQLKFYNSNGSGPMFLNDDAPMDEIARAMMIAATTEQGNGSSRHLKGRQTEMEVKDGSNVRRK